MQTNKILTDGDGLQPQPKDAQTGDPSRPLYLRLAHSLKDEIVDGTYPIGTQLPTEGALGARFNVSRHTIREALRWLRDDGLVSSRQGAGTIVVPPRSSDSYVNQMISIADLVAFAAGTHFAIETIKMVKIDKKLALRTGLTIGEEWLEVRGYRLSIDGELPVCLAEYYINSKFAAVGRLLQRHTGPIFALIEDLFGRSIVEVDQEITAVIVPATLEEGLKVEPGTAALSVRRCYMMADGAVAQTTINTHPASRFSHSMTMRRVKA